MSSVRASPSRSKVIAAFSITFSQCAAAATTTRSGVFSTSVYSQEWQTPSLPPNDACNVIGAAKISRPAVFTDTGKTESRYR